MLGKLAGAPDTASLHGTRLRELLRCETACFRIQCSLRQYANCRHTIIYLSIEMPFAQQKIFSRNTSFISFRRRLWVALVLQGKRLFNANLSRYIKLALH